MNKYSPVNGKACYALNMWEKALSAQTEPLVPLTITDKCDMQHIYKSKRIRPQVYLSSFCNSNYVTITLQISRKESSTLSPIKKIWTILLNQPGSNRWLNWDRTSIY